MKSIFVVLLWGLLCNMTGAQISLNSTLIRGKYALPNQEVIFTCISVNATILNWNSTEYIGDGNVFPIASIGPARNRTSGTTVATRLDTYIEGGSTVIISQLRIIASEEFPNSAVTCRVNGDGPSETIRFITTENALQEVSLNSTLIHGMYALPNQEVIFTCTSVNATILNWNSTEYIGDGNVFPIASIGPARNRTSGTTVATRLDTYVEGGNTVIISQLHIIALEQFPSSAVTCRVNGDGPSETIRFITTEFARTTTSVAETMEIPTDGNNDSFVTDNYDSTQESAACSGACGLGIGIGVVCVVFIGVVAIFIIIIVIVKHMRKGRKVYNIESDESEEGDNIKDESEEGDDIKKPLATSVKETNEEPESLVKSEKEPLLVPIFVGIGNARVVVRGRETSNTWKQPVGLAHSTSLPNVVAYTKDEDDYIVSSSLPQLNVDGSTSRFPRYDSKQLADIESGSDIHVGVMDTCDPEPSEKKANEKPDEVDPKPEKKPLLDLDIKKQGVIHDEGDSGTCSGESGVDDESSSASEYEMDSRTIEQGDEAHSEDSGVDDSSNGMECEMESKLEINKKCEQVGEVPKPKIEEETTQNPDSNEKSNRGGGVTEPEDKVDGKVDLQHTLCESPHGDLVSFERQDSNHCDLADSIVEFYKHITQVKKVTYKLHVTGELGSSEFGRVSKGMWESPKGGMDVAVKQLQPGASKEEKVKLLLEGVINGLFGRPNVVKLVIIEPRQDSDYCELGDIIVVVCERMKKTSSKLRSGEFGTVSKGMQESPMGGMDVAKKQLQPGASEEEKVKFPQEVAINGQLKHPNIVKLVTKGEPVVHSKVDRAFPKQWQLHDSKFYHRIVSALEYMLYKPSFVHRNMYPDYIFKILSNLAKSRMEENYYNSGMKIPVMWTAPEPIVAPCTFYGQVHENSDFMFMRWSPAPLFGFGLAKQKQGKPSNMHSVMQSLMSYWHDDMITGYKSILDYYLTDLLALAKKSNKCSCDKDGVNRGFPGKQREPGAKGNAGSFGRLGHPRKAERPNTGSRNLRQRKKGCASDLNYVCRDQDKVKRPRPAGCKNIKLE